MTRIQVDERTIESKTKTGTRQSPRWNEKSHQLHYTGLETNVGKKSLTRLR